MVNKKVRRRLFRSKRRAVRYGLVIINIALFVGVASFIVANRPSISDAPAPTLLSVAIEDDITDPLDVLSSTDIAFNITLMAGMPQAAALVHEVDAEIAKVSIVINGSQTVSKPQIIKTELKSKNDIAEYTVVSGDTVATVAKKFEVSSNSIRWSNNITGSALRVGDKLKIPPVDGIVYKVKNGDTTKSLATKFHSNESRIIAFNDAEIDGLIEGEYVLVPDGEIATTPSIYSFVASHGGNTYAYGNCTFYAKSFLSWVPNGLGNANTWDDRARFLGYTVSSVPTVGSIAQTDYGYYGHIAVVTGVHDGLVDVTEMNYRGYNVISNRTVSVGTFKYIRP